MIGGHGVQVAEGQAAPQVILVPLLAERRGHDVLGALEVGLVVVAVVQEEVLGAGLGEGVDAAVAGALDLVEGVGAREVHDVDGHVGDFGDRDRPVAALGLHAGGAGVGVPARRGLALFQGALDDLVDDDAVLGMHADHGAVLAGFAHGAVDRRVIRVEHAGVGHEELVAGDALVGEAAHLVEALVGHVGDDHVEGVVDGGLALGLGVPGVQALEGGAALGLHGEVHHRGGAAEGRGAGAGLEVVGAVGAAEGHVEVGVGVDASRNDQLAGRVDHGVRRHVEVLADEGDALALDEDVREIVIHRRDDSTVLDQQAHSASPLLAWNG
ncbi:hypothetical protein D3C72_941010 [compost metagenome]